MKVEFKIDKCRTGGKLYLLFRILSDQEDIMTRNVGTVDMLIRLIVSAGLFYIGFFHNPVVSGGLSQKIIAGAAFLPLLTALFRFCPLYSLIGLNTASSMG